MQYRTLENVVMDGRNIPPGQLVDLTETAARQLLATGAVEPVHKRFARPVASPGQPG